TEDIALGNLLDTFAREVGIAPPYVVEGSHAVDICAEGGSFLGEVLPYVVKGQDVSFSGLLTAALKLYRSGGYSLRDICFTLREVAFSAVVEVTERCLAHTGKREVTLTGGVAANKVLNNKMRRKAQLHGARYEHVPVGYAGDNGVMIAVAGLGAFKAGVTIDPRRAFIRQRWRIDQVDLPWYPWTPKE
ncbi:MAG: UGMP family protein, partial [Aquificota bacterium]|nr:UGMP family protein [Aquificota bacterium]